jgi:hypothetical protein
LTNDHNIPELLLAGILDHPLSYPKYLKTV